MRNLLFLSILLLAGACSSEDPVIENPEMSEDQMYFPPLSTSTWETRSLEELGWDATALTNLYQFHQDNNSRALLVLKNGRLVIEEYWGNKIDNSTAFDQDSFWYWASAGKSLTAFLVGLAQQEGLLNINDKSSDHLGVGWTSLSPEKEALITVKDQLSMATGLDYTVDNLDCTDPECLTYNVDAGSQWYYHNGPYTLLEQVVSTAANTTYNNFTDSRIESQIGMSGTWLASGYNNVYWSTPRDAARFGLLMLNQGSWDGDELLNDSSYFNAMISSSQGMNPAYGYLWWLNGKSSIILPSLANSFPIALAPNAPSDLYAAMGKNGQFIAVVPSQDLVVVRMGEAPDDSLVPALFHDEMWGLLDDLIGF